MKILVVSDTHLTHRFDQHKYGKLLKLIKNTDKVIINGDFWERDFISFDDFKKSKWNKLFPILKNKDTVYLHGNHDEKSDCDERVHLFSNKQGYWHRVVLKKGDRLNLYKQDNLSHKATLNSSITLVFNHGHSIVPHQNILHKLLDIKLLKFLRPLARLFIQIRILAIGEKHFNLFKGENSKIKKWARDSLSPNEIIVCGHSHLQEFSLSERFIDLGLFSGGFYQYMIIEKH